jgi:Ethylbenzene dehydrogenase/Prokaryotic cytochrome b561
VDKFAYRNRFNPYSSGKMRMNPEQRQRADLPTLLIHWGMVAALLVSVSTGWRIASMTDQGMVLRWVDVLLLQGNVIRWHFVSAALLTALVLAYVVFLWRMGLGGRLALRLASLRSPDRTTRWQAVNRLVYWIAIALLAGAALTGSLLYFAPGLVRTEGLVSLHQWLSWGFVAYIVVHVVAQVVLGGLRQLLKIVSPRLAYGLGAGAALVAGVAGAAAAYVADSSSLAALVVARATSLPTLDGDGSDAVWQSAPETVVHTIRGFNLDGGEVSVHVRALHDGKQAYFLFRWPDATRSQKHVPLIKTDAGWKLLHTNYFNNDENEFYEDKFAVMLARSPVAGGNTVKLGPKPLADKPGPSNGLGLHAATDGSLADVWHWKSVRTGVLNQFDDNYFGAPMEAKPGRYTGGYTQDPKTAGGYEQNFEKIGDGTFVKLKYLPRDLSAQQARMGRFNPDSSISDEGSFAMARTDVVPYSAALDVSVPVGTVIPSVVNDKPFEGDRGDVAVHAKWKDGWWTLEAKRNLDTGSRFDQPIEEGMFMWFAVFDHNQVRHTRHVRPVRIRLQ